MCFALFLLRPGTRHPKMMELGKQMMESFCEIFLETFPGSIGWRSLYGKISASLSMNLSEKLAANNPNVLQTIGRFLDFLRFNSFLMAIWGFNYFKIANLGFRTYCNTCLGVFGTSSKSTKYGPSDP